MELGDLAVLITGTILMGFVYWFFFMKKEELVQAGTEIDIEVNGGYKPSRIELKKKQLTKVSFLRKDESSCLEEVVLSDFKIKKYLPLNKKVSIEIKPTKKGEYFFSCGMNMFHGKLIVN